MQKFEFIYKVTHIFCNFALMFNKEINFDRFVRGMIYLVLFVAVIFALNYLSSVLIPFFVAWLMAYLLYPIVHFFQYKCRLKSRFLSIVVTLALLIGIVCGFVYFTVPPIIEEALHLKDIAMSFIQGEGQKQMTGIVAEVQRFYYEHQADFELDKILSQQDIQSAIKTTVPKLWNMIWSTAGMLMNLVSLFFGVLYFFFILNDYEKYAEGWLRFVPKRHRARATHFLNDVETAMNGYFRGQALVALSNMVMFTIGFLIIGFPLPVLMGVLIGVLSFVPYVQVAGFIPAAVLALLRCVETGQNFWVLMLLVLVVYIVVQIIQDTVFTPHIMGKILNLHPAIVLLALTVWGYVLGLIGLIIALPVTTLIISYYENYLVPGNAENVEKSDKTVGQVEKKS